MDTNNITEAFNNVLRRRYLPLRQDTTVHAFVQILTEVAFPELESNYMQSIIKQTQAYRKPRYDIPLYLEGRPNKIQSLCMLNIERAKLITKKDIHEVQRGIFEIKSKGTNIWSINVTSGKCTCPAFESSHTPCKHFFAIFHHYPSWSWNDLPASLTESNHMVLDTISEPPTNDISTNSPLVTVTTNSNSQELPGKTKTTANVIYRLQKNIEETVARCRTLAFFTSDVTALENALAHCEAARNTLATSATSTQDNLPPIITAIEKAGVEDFKKTSKHFHRTSIKHQASTRKVRTTTGRAKVMKEPLLKGCNIIVGRPKLKKKKIRKKCFPRQISQINREKFIKATRVLRKGT